jgi:hypothetical protein
MSAYRQRVPQYDRKCFFFPISAVKGADPDGNKRHPWPLKEYKTGREFDTTPTSCPFIRIINNAKI